ncbi:MAG: hypothetical protein KC503_01830 [Myxococcales bacterium]|nr:hypothetical protein [Myxococcales bacterium]
MSLAPLALTCAVALCCSACSDSTPSSDTRGGEGLVVDAGDARVVEAGADSGDASADAAVPMGVIAKSVTGNSAVRDRRLAIDNKGNIYFCARANGEIDFGGKLHKNSGEDALLVAFDAALNYRWSKSFGGTDADRAFAVDTDDAGNVYVVGNFKKTMDVDGTQLTADGDTLDIFAVSFDSSGTLRWAKRFGGSGHDSARGVSAVPSGGATIGGSLDGAVSFGTHTVDSGAVPGGFVARLDDKGDVLWARGLVSTVSVDVAALARGANGSVVAAATFDGTLDPGKGSLTNSGGEDGLLVAYDAQGATLWQRAWGDDKGLRAHDVTSDGSGNLFVVSSLVGTIKHGSATLVGSGIADACVLAFDSAGQPTWGKNLAPASGASARLYGVAWSGSQLVVVGALRGSLTFGGQSYSTDAQVIAGGLIVTFDASGTAGWSRLYDASRLDAELTGVAARGARVYVTGSLFGKASFEGVPLESKNAGGPDTLLLSFEGP